MSLILQFIRFYLQNFDFQLNFFQRLINKMRIRIFWNYVHRQVKKIDIK